jgi:protein disulfide-isomerase-like protein
MAKGKMNMNMNMDWLKNVDRNMVENVVIFVLLLVILVLLAKHYMRGSESESFQVEDEARLVLYYAPWCPHCKHFMGEWENLGTSQNVNGVEVKVEKIDCQENAEVAERENIEGFPTVKLHSKNGSMEYNGARNADAVILWLQKSL